MKSHIKLPVILLILCVQTNVFGYDVIISPKTQGTLRIMTYNIRRKGKEETTEREWQSRLALVFELLNEIGPDICGLQEPTDEQIADLHEQLPGFALFGKSRGTSWIRRGTDEYNPIFYNQDKFELLEHGTFSINKLEGVRIWMPWHAKKTGWLPRICTWGKFRVKATNQEFYLYNTHFDHKYEQAKINCAKAVVKHIQQHTAGLPVIVTGDFNTAFAGKVKKEFGKFNHVKKIAQQKVGPHATATGWDSKNSKWIDHILINKKDTIDVLRYEVVDHQNEIYASDHCPVFVDITFNEVI